MLRTKDVELGGQTVKIANLQLGPKRRYIEALEAIQSGKANGTSLVQAIGDVLLSSLQRADPSFTRDRLDTLDDDDLRKLMEEVTRWSGPQDGEPSPGEAPGSP